jgi:hypothetical protein
MLKPSCLFGPSPRFPFTKMRCTEKESDQESATLDTTGWSQSEHELRCICLFRSILHEHHDVGRTELRTARHRQQPMINRSILRGRCSRSSDRDLGRHSASRDSRWTIVVHVRIRTLYVVSILLYCTHGAVS